MSDSQSIEQSVKKEEYLKSIQPYRNQIGKLEKAQNTLRLQKKNKLGNDFSFENADFHFNIASYHLQINKISGMILGVHNEPSLEGARKHIVAGISGLEDLFGIHYDISLEEQKELFDSLKLYREELRRFRVLSKLGFLLDSIKKNYDEQSRKFWHILDLQAKAVRLIYKSLDLRKLNSEMDLVQNGDEAHQKRERLHLVQVLLEKTSLEMRKKYEICGQATADGYQAIQFLESLKKLYMQLNKTDKVDELVKTIGVWTEKVESDRKK